MTKAQALKVINTILFILMVVQAVTGLGQRFFGQSVFILFRRIHYPNGLLLLVIAALHLKFNWGWVRGNLLKIPSRK